MDDNKKQEEVKNLEKLTPEEREAVWMDWVRSEVNSALDIFLPISLQGDVNVKYFPHIVEELETGVVLDKTKADGVQLKLVFKFEETLDFTKPIVTEEKD